mgnify:CR=1 FL=1
MSVSKPLAWLLKHIKSGQGDKSWRNIGQGLEQFYFTEMGLHDVFEVIVNLYEEALNEPRLQLGSGQNAYRRVLFAPFKAHGQSAEQLSLEHFYDLMINEMASSLITATVDWCRLE